MAYSSFHLNFLFSVQSSLQKRGMKLVNVGNLLILMSYNPEYNLTSTCLNPEAHFFLTSCFGSKQATC